MKLWFEDNWGRRRVIAKCHSHQEVIKAIRKFVNECNEHNQTPFKIYYIRYWTESGMTKYDVGSHTEFFYWEGKIE